MKCPTHCPIQYLGSSFEVSYTLPSKCPTHCLSQYLRSCFEVSYKWKCTTLVSGLEDIVANLAIL